MPLSYTQYVGNGSNRGFAVPFLYINKAHVGVRVNGNPVSFAWSNDSFVTLDTAPPAGSVVDVRRTTPNSTRVVDFVDGSTLTESDLDQSSVQFLYLSQEAQDRADEAPRLTYLNTYDFQGRRATNLADPVAAQDATTKAWVESDVNSSVARSRANADEARAAQMAAEYAAAHPDLSAALVRAQNLNDLISIPDARRNLGLKGGAILDVGVPGGLVAYDDPRLGAGSGTPVPKGTQLTFHVDDYGADPTGVKDSRAAFNACWTACRDAGGGTVSFKGKGKVKYLLGGPVVWTFAPLCGGIAIEGSHQDACTLYFPNGGGLEVQFTSNRNGCHASNFTCLTDAFGVGEGLCFKNIYYGAAGHSHICFNSINYVTCTGTQEAGQFRGCYWARGISMRGTTYVNIVGCITEGGSNGEFTVPFLPKGIGIAVAGSPIVPEHNSNQTYGLIYNLKDCTMNCHDIGFLYDNFVQGVTIDATNIGYCRVAISTVSAENEYKGGSKAADGTTNEGSLLAQLYVTNSQVGANYGNVVEFLVAMFTASFVNCTFFIRRNKYGIYAPVYVPIRVDNCTFQGDGALIPANETRPDGVVAGTVGVYLGPAAVAGGTVHNTDFVALGNGLLLSCSGCKFDGLDFKDCDIPVQDNGNNNIFGALMYASRVKANLPPVTIPPKTAQPNSASRELQFESRKANGATVLGKLYLDTDGNLTLVSTENSGTVLPTAILNILHNTLAAKHINAQGGVTVRDGLTVGGNVAGGSLNINGAAAVGQITTNSHTVNGGASVRDNLAAGSLNVNGAAAIGSLTTNSASVLGNLAVSGGFAVAGGAPVGKQAITGNITGDFNGIRNTLISVIQALLAYNMVTNNTN